MVEQTETDKASGTDSGVHQAIIPESMVNLNMGLLIGSHETVAQSARRGGDDSGPGGRAADLRRVRQRHRRSSATRIQPLMNCRRHVTPLARAAE